MSVADVARPGQRLLNVDEAAEVLNVSPRWVRRAIFEKRFTVVKVGHFVRIPEGEITDFIKRSTVERAS